jgi:hypothetical protein
MIESQNGHSSLFWLIFGDRWIHTLNIPKLNMEPTIRAFAKVLELEITHFAVQPKP